MYEYAFQWICPPRSFKLATGLINRRRPRVLWSAINRKLWEEVAETHAVLVRSFQRWSVNFSPTESDSTNDDYLRFPEEFSENRIKKKERKTFVFFERKIAESGSRWSRTETRKDKGRIFSWYRTTIVCNPPRNRASGRRKGKKKIK